ncbi:MAG: LptE family protein [candidate division WOR-3 bacterium]|nr:MAG: LptE family protein [candidate division WOR-3 bacterium]
MRYAKLTLVIILLFIFCGLSVLSCCGYSTRSLMPEYLQKIHIRIFQNRTLKTGLDEVATEAVIEAFRSSSNLRIVDEGSADLVLEGSVAGYSKEPHTYTSDQTILEYRITIKYSARCVDRIRNEVFWESDVSDWALYTTDEEGSIREAAKKAAERLVTGILTSW